MTQECVDLIHLDERKQEKKSFKFFVSFSFQRLTDSGNFHQWSLKRPIVYQFGFLMSYLIDAEQFYFRTSQNLTSLFSDRIQRLTDSRLSVSLYFLQFDELENSKCIFRCRSPIRTTLPKRVLFKMALHKIQRLTASEIFHYRLVSRTFLGHFSRLKYIQI